MCGIAGYIGRRPPDDTAVKTCLAAMRHRGPDASGTYRHSLHADWHVCLLHTRLSIIGLAPRVDPYRREGRVLSFNGETYNYLELKQELAARGDTFLTTGDTEVLIAGLNRFGL